MNKLTNTDYEHPIIYNLEIYTNIKTLFDYGKHLINDGYIMIQSLDGSYNACLYVYAKDTDLGKDMFYLFISDAVTKRMNNDDWNHKSSHALLKDCENIWCLADASDLDQLKKDDPDIVLLDYFFSLLDDFNDYYAE